jgi:alkylhydroperoxidase/carboxymuconolactone decarboxylase family protein YurZ
MREATSAALDAGLTPEQIVEVQLLVAAVGVHAIHEGIRELRDVLLERGEADIAIPRDDAGRRTLREEHQGSSSYWQRLEVELPGFLEGLLTVSPAAYAAFFDICAMPWRHGTLPALTKELVYLAIDATPTHRYGPGFRLHLGNALRLGASRDQVLRALDVASAAPCHVGVR